VPPAPLVLAHRGASHQARENTVEAFALARDLGADGVELDVRRTADGTLVVHHDPAIEGVGILAELAFAELRAARPYVPTLGEALAACAGMLVNVEVNCLPWEADADPGYDVARLAVDAARGHDAGIVVSSFDLGALDAVRAHAPDVATGFLVYGRDPAAMARLASEHGHGWLHPDRAAVLANLDAVAACHDAGVQVDVWTVDDPDDIRTLTAHGVDAIITNVPDIAVGAVQ
jgi:glycerophosphoryl diester phosphodiesterase